MKKSAFEGVHPMKNQLFLEKAEALRPKLIEKETVKNCDVLLKKGDEVFYDFGNHFVGCLSLDFSQVGAYPDAPLQLHLSFYESSEEFDEDPAAYRGGLGGSWIQEERIHIDDVPGIHRLPRRYAFRYLRIRVMDHSGNYTIRLNRLILNSVSSADDARLLTFSGREEDRHMDTVAVRTLHECMQTVFEDGPKRDRRLWLGNLRLQAMANYVTYRNYDLVKRCLYLFAGDTLDNGQVVADIFCQARVVRDDLRMTDYSLFFISTLWDYYGATGDLETLTELAPTARRQYEVVSESFTEAQIMGQKMVDECFVDWSGLEEKQSAAQAIYVYALKDLVKICQVLGQPTKQLEEEIRRKSETARSRWFDREQGVFLGGDRGTLSWASQIWMILSGIVSPEEGVALLQRIEACPTATPAATPYLYHHYIQALLLCGQKQKAYEKMKAYWGGMLDRGADTFWEIYNPDNPDLSPYGGKIIHSYCHAWSCTPAYFLRTCFRET